MINQLGWDTLEQCRLLSQSTMLYKIQQSPMGILFPLEVFPLDRAAWLPKCNPYRHIQCNCNAYKFSFYPRSIIVWNQLASSTLPLQSIPIFKSAILPTIKYLAYFFTLCMYLFTYFVICLFIYLFIHSSFTYLFTFLLLDQLFFLKLGFAN